MRWRVRGDPGPQVVPVTLWCRLDVLLQMGPYPIGVERARGAERPRERRATLGTGEALRDGMQPCTTPGEPPPQVRDEHPVHRDDPQQVVGRCPGAAPDTGPDRPPIGSRADRGGVPAVRGFRPGRRTGLKCTASPVSGAPHRGYGPLRRSLRRPPRTGVGCGARPPVDPRDPASLRMSMRHPVSRAASRAFCPSLPMARESWKSGTITRAVAGARVEDAHRDDLRRGQGVADERRRGRPTSR